MCGLTDVRTVGHFRTGRRAGPLPERGIALTAVSGDGVRSEEEQMANELRFTGGANLLNGNLNDSTPQQTLLVTQSLAALLSKVVNVTTSESDLTTSEVTTLGWAWLQNLDTTNYVQYGPKSGGAMVTVGRLKAGEWALLRLEPGITIRWKANTAACQVLVKIFND
jgi:hypothetical protein